jgi:hypothetical protein
MFIPIELLLNVGDGAVYCDSLSQPITHEYRFVFTIVLNFSFFIAYSHKIAKSKAQDLLSTFIKP